MMRLQGSFPKLKQQMLIHAHGTDLWASYQPQLPNWSYLLATVGLASIVVGVLANWVALGRIALMIIGVLFCVPLAVSARFAYFSKKRRTAARKQVLDSVNWRGDEAVLDVGCGSGMLLNGAAQRVPHGSATGVDIWAEQSGSGDLKLLYRHAQAEGVENRIIFKEMDARQMTFKDESFDMVFSSWAVHHIIRSREEFDQLAAEMLRVLKPGGIMVVLDTAHMIEALTIRMENAGLEVSLQEAPLGQKIVVGKKR